MAQPNPSTLEQAAVAFGVQAGDLSLVRDAVNVIYEFTYQGKPYILRLAPAAQRNRDSILGEMEWMDYLAAHGGHVPQPMYSTSGKLVETVGEDGSRFHVSVFEKIPGVHPENELLDEALLVQMGQALGRMHRLGRKYKPSAPALVRPQWYELEAFALLDRIPATQLQVRSACREMLNTLQTLPTDPEGYGLIHADPEPWNMLLHDGVLTFIDFDEACFCWYTFDLAVALLYAVIAARPADRDTFAPQAWRWLYAGYAEEHPLSSFWLQQIPLFLRLRVMEDYAFHLIVWDMDNMEEWQAPMLAWQRRVIETGEPVLLFQE